MAQATTSTRPLFKRAAVRRRDETVFVGKLCVLALLIATGVVLAVQPSVLITALGVVILGAAYAHAVELQHQCLHHSAFRAPRPHRLVGVALGLPMLVSYSHYRVRHLQHHRYLGTPEDSEFFGFDPRAQLTVGALAKGLFDVGRLVEVGRSVAASVSGRWEYDLGQISPKSRRAVIAEYRLFAVVAALLVIACAAGEWSLVLRLCLLPLLVAMPIHFLVELPEHILCDSSSVDVLRNTRSISGSWFTTWFTNGNNLHIEHHAAMNVPINRLRERHPLTREVGVHVQRTYAEFFAIVAREVGKVRSGAAADSRGDR